MKILFFAQLEECVGQREIEITTEPITVNELKSLLLEKYPNLPSLEHSIVAINEEYSDEQTVIKSEDTVAFIPPVSGG